LPDTTGALEVPTLGDKKVSAVFPDAKAMIHFIRTGAKQRMTSKIYSLSASPVPLAISARNEALAFSLDARITADTCLDAKGTPEYYGFNGHHFDMSEATRIQVRAQPPTEKRKAPDDGNEAEEAPVAKVARVDE
jgi:hypothetical protein